MDKLRKQINANSKAKSILVIDDNCTACLLINEILSDYNIRIPTANTGNIALWYIENFEKFDLIIIDIRLPDMDGFDLLYRIKATSPSVPIIAHTALVSKQIKEICLNCGFSEFIEKPSEIDTFISIINKYIS